MTEEIHTAPESVGAEDNQEDRYLSSALARGLAIIRCFDQHHTELSLTEIAELLGVSRSVPFRFVYTLEALGYLRQDSHSKRYHLTPKVMELGYAYMQSLQINDVVMPVLKQLRDSTGFSAHMGVLQGSSVVYVARVPATAITSVNIHVGARLPSHATAMGKVLLAYQPPSVVQALYGENRSLEVFTQNTKVSVEALLADLKAIRERGYAISNEEFEYGIRSVAVPILNARGESEAAINVAAIPSAVDGEKQVETMLPALKQAQDALESYLVHSGRTFDAEY